MKNFKLLVLVTTVAFLFGIASCDDENGSSNRPEKSCLLTSVVSGSGNKQITYDQFRRIVQVTEPYLGRRGEGYFWRYTYTGNTVVVKNHGLTSLTNPRAPISEDRYQLNSQGFIVSAVSIDLVNNWSNRIIQLYFNGNTPSSAVIGNVFGSDSVVSEPLTIEEMLLRLILTRKIKGRSTY